MWLPFGVAWAPADWERSLGGALERRVEVRYGDSRRVPVRVGADGGEVLRVRLHRLFAGAPAEVVVAMGRWLRVGRRARRDCDLLDRWIEVALAGLPPVISPLDPRGRVYDLSGFLGEIVAGHLPELAGREPAVTWGRRARSVSRNSLQLGSFDPDSGLVRLHPVLDHREVPAFFVGFVLFHELLHAAVPGTPGGPHHPPEFRRRERAHPDHRRAEAWERRNLPALIRRARRGYRSADRGQLDR